MDEALVARVAKKAGCSKALARTVIETFFQLRMGAAREAFEKRGGHWGRPSTVDDLTLRRALALRERNVPVREIARRMNVPPSTLARWLSK